MEIYYIDDNTYFFIEYFSLKAPNISFSHNCGYFLLFTQLVIKKKYGIAITVKTANFMDKHF